MSWPSPSPTPSWRQEIFQDAARIWKLERPSLKDLTGAFLKDPGIAAAILFRLSARLGRKGHPLLATLFVRLNLALHGCQINFRARIGPGLRLAHTGGIVVGKGVQAGSDLTLFQNVTLGARGWETEDYPMLGDDVIIYPNSLVIGGIRVGAGARVGAASVVLRDVEAGDTVAGAPARSIRNPGEIRNHEGQEAK